MKTFIVLTAVFGVALCDKSLLGGYGAPPLADYGIAPPLGVYEGGSVTDGGLSAAGGADDASAIPGVPGTDYPIYNEVPETSFACEGKVEGGYYADPEAECQVFHICTADGLGGLLKMSLLCHNGTIFNQELFTCDLWSNVNCADAEGLYSKNEELAAAREEASAALAAAAAAAAGSSAAGGYGAPPSGNGAPQAPPANGYGPPLPSYGAALASYA